MLSLEIENLSENPKIINENSARFTRKFPNGFLRNDLLKIVNLINKKNAETRRHQTSACAKESGHR